MTLPVSVRLGIRLPRWTIAVLLFVLLSVTPAWADDEHLESGIAPVAIDFFYEAGCPDCLRVRTRILPELAERFEGFYDLNQYDIGIVSNMSRLVA